MKIVKDINYFSDDNPAHTLDFYLPENKEFKVFIYFHGGGLESGNKDSAERFAEDFNKNKIAVISCNYRMYPLAVYPDFIRDAAAAVGWVFQNIGNYGTATDIYIGGASAGAYLSMMLCFDKKYLAPYGIKPTDIAGFIHDGGQPTKHFNILRENGIDPRRVIIDETAPLYHIGTEQEYPPMLFVLAENDMENRYEQTMLMLATLKHFGFENGITFKVLPGCHGQYAHEKNERGENKFAITAVKFINE